MTTSRGDTTAAPLSSVSPQLEAAAEAGGGQLVAGGWAEPAQAASSLYTQQRTSSIWTLSHRHHSLSPGQGSMNNLQFPVDSVDTVGE